MISVVVFLDISSQKGEASNHGERRSREAGGPPLSFSLLSVQLTSFCKWIGSIFFKSFIIVVSFLSSFCFSLYI